MAPVQGDRSRNQVKIPCVDAYTLQQERQEAEGLPPAYLRKSASSQRYSWKQPSHLLSATTSTHQTHRSWGVARAGGSAAVTDRPKSETSRTSNVMNFQVIQIIEDYSLHWGHFWRCLYPESISLQTSEAMKNKARHKLRYDFLV